MNYSVFHHAAINIFYSDGEYSLHKKSLRSVLLAGITFRHRWNPAASLHLNASPILPSDLRCGFIHYSSIPQRLFATTWAALSECVVMILVGRMWSRGILHPGLLIFFNKTNAMNHNNPKKNGKRLLNQLRFLALKVVSVFHVTPHTTHYLDLSKYIIHARILSG